MQQVLIVVNILNAKNRQNLDALYHALSKLSKTTQKGVLSCDKETKGTSTIICIVTAVS